MAYREVTMVEIKEVLRLWRAGFKKKRIASSKTKSSQKIPERGFFVLVFFKLFLRILLFQYLCLQYRLRR